MYMSAGALEVRFGVQIFAALIITFPRLGRKQAKVKFLKIVLA